MGQRSGRAGRGGRLECLDGDGDQEEDDDEDDGVDTEDEGGEGDDGLGVLLLRGAGGLRVVDFGTVDVRTAWIELGTSLFLSEARL